jgi:hypothetical protein
MESDSGHSYGEGAADSRSDNESADVGSDEDTATSVSEYTYMYEDDNGDNISSRRPQIHGPRYFHDDVSELFGGSYYTYRIERAKLHRIPAIPYRDAGWVVGNEVGKRGFDDETIISGFLSKLSFEYLNEIGWKVSTRCFIHGVRLFIGVEVSLRYCFVLSRLAKAFSILL